MGEIFTIQRNRLKSEILKRIMDYDVSLKPKLTGKLIRKTQIYLEGYIEASKDSFESPFRDEEIMPFLFDEAFKYIVRNIED